MDDKSPIISIVVPSYNHARYLSAAVESVLAQDYGKVELIVIDDGSTDGSREVLERFGKRFHWEVQANRGQAATLNKGWTMSRGDILAYLSADDVLLPSAVSRSVAVLERNPDVVLTYCDFNLIDPDSNVIRRVRAPDFEYRDMVIRMICHPGPGAFFRRRAFEQAGPWHTGYRQHADLEFWLRLGLHGRFQRIPEVLAAFRVHPGSQSFSSVPVLRPEEPVKMIEEYFANPLVPDSLRAERKQALGAAYLEKARLHFRISEYRKALAAARTAIGLHPRQLLSLRTARIAFNALFNRLGHRLLWSVRRARRPG